MHSPDLEITSENKSVQKKRRNSNFKDKIVIVIIYRGCNYYEKIIWPSQISMPYLQKNVFYLEHFIRHLK